MYKIIGVITVVVFAFLFLVFMPFYGSDNDISNIIYLNSHKHETVENKLIVKADNINSEGTLSKGENENDNNNTDISGGDANVRESDGKFIWPLDNGVGQISSVLGHRWGTVHKGWDISTLGVSQPIYSVGDGTVIRTGISGSLTTSFGYICCVSYTDPAVGEFMIIYPHMKSETNLKVGDKVSKGDLIGYTGTTGNSTGIHLHFQMGPVNDYNNFYNPLRLLYGMKMTRSDIESHFGLVFQADAMGTAEDQQYNIDHNIDTLLRTGWNQ